MGPLNPGGAIRPYSFAVLSIEEEESLQRHLQNAGNPAGDGSRFVYNIRIISLSFPETMEARFKRLFNRPTVLFVCLCVEISTGYVV